MSEVDICKRHVRAVTRMMLGRKVLQPGVALLAGGTVDLAKRLELARLARDSYCDLIHLTFNHVDGGYQMTGIDICAPRNIAVYTYPDCRLSMIGNRAVIMPPVGGRGHFVLTPRELIHKPAKPDMWEAGIEHAEHRLRQLVDQGVNIDGQIALHTVPKTA